MSNQNKRLAMRTARNSIFVNAALIIFKFFAGIVANSTAMTADAVHSLTDLLGTCVAMVGIKLGARAADDDHPYGHERFESVATLVLAAMIFVVGALIGWAGVSTVIAGNFDDILVPGILALAAAVVSLVVKESLYWYVRAAAKKIDSPALMADAKHSRVDALTSIGSFVGILGAMLGIPVMDALAAIFISLFIIKTAFEISSDALGRMTDRACEDEIVDAMRQTILAQNEVEEIQELRTRIFGNRIYVDVDIIVRADATLEEAHNTSHAVHDAIEREFPKVKHCMVHVEPSKRA
jgi:cation diffusion facilitator family transporter